MTPQERAENILQEIQRFLVEGKCYYDKSKGILTAEISEAEEAAELRAYRLSDETWKKRLEEAESEARIAGVAEGIQTQVEYEMTDALRKAKIEGFDIAKEQAAKMVATYNVASPPYRACCENRAIATCDALAEQIRAMKPTNEVSKPDGKTEK